MGHVTPAAHNAPERSDWRSPGSFLDLVRKVGPIVCDPATGPDNPTGARLFFSLECPVPLGASLVLHKTNGGVWVGPCGLSAPWPERGLVYINPPWGAHLSGDVDPAYEIVRNGALVGVGRGWAARIAQHEGEALALTPTRTDSAWFYTLQRWADLRLDWHSSKPREGRLGARLQFLDPDTGKVRGGNNSACTVWYRGPNVDTFARVFEPHGELLPGGRLSWR